MPRAAGLQHPTERTSLIKKTHERCSYVCFARHQVFVFLGKHDRQQKKKKKSKRLAEARISTVQIFVCLCVLASQPPEEACTCVYASVH